MNIILIILAIASSLVAIGLVIKNRAYVAALIYLAIAMWTLSLTRMSEYTVHHEPMIALYKNDVLIVLDSNKTVYTDSTYMRGKICLDEEIHKNIFGYSSSERRVLNTLCQ